MRIWHRSRRWNLAWWILITIVVGTNLLFTIRSLYCIAVYCVVFDNNNKDARKKKAITNISVMTFCCIIVMHQSQYFNNIRGVGSDSRWTSDIGRWISHVKTRIMSTDHGRSHTSKRESCSPLRKPGRFHTSEVTWRESCPLIRNNTLQRLVDFTGRSVRIWHRSTRIISTATFYWSIASRHSPCHQYSY